MTRFGVATAPQNGNLGEPSTVIRRSWTEDEPFDFHGEHLDLTGHSVIRSQFSDRARRS